MKDKTTSVRWSWIIICTFVCIGAILGVLHQITTPVLAAESPRPDIQKEGYAGSESCKKCHEDIHKEWTITRHAQAFSSPIFQRDWSKVNSDVKCLECHTTGYDPATGKFTQEGVACESCHGPFQSDHPDKPMPLTPDADLCQTCHKTTTDEWHASKHSQAGIQCQDCHNPHSQTPKAKTITELCTNCHKERGDTFTHSTHSSSGLECSNCHMFSKPRTDDPIGGLVATGHTFSVGSEACIGCHQDTVHTRDEIVKLSGQVAESAVLKPEELQKKIQEQEATISELESRSTVRLYTGLAQGAIVGLVMGGVVAWIVSRRITIDEEDEGEQEEN
jgi:predicted CXXCH cytochrome family protein